MKNSPVKKKQLKKIHLLQRKNFGQPVSTKHELYRQYGRVDHLFTSLGGSNVLQLFPSLASTQNNRQVQNDRIQWVIVNFHQQWTPTHLCNLNHKKLENSIFLVKKKKKPQIKPEAEYLYHPPTDQFSENFLNQFFPTRYPTVCVNVESHLNFLAHMIISSILISFHIWVNQSIIEKFKCFSGLLIKL